LYKLYFKILKDISIHWRGAIAYIDYHGGEMFALVMAPMG